ncbi:MAG: hypothetical protein GAK43_00001 [Stenotrophomonas maltophilia]|nr:MAG: hypothetical protein GAK43_00001 [Stenotrophomonas maltophilia]
MDMTGFLSAFPNDRPLSDAERELRLLQKKRLDVPLLAQLCVVKINSNALLSADRWFGWRGYVALLGLIGVAFGLGITLMMLWLLLVEKLPNENGLWQAMFFGVAMGLALAAAGAWVARREMFRWTYYPIALDRKRRQVHVFRLDGTVLTAAWDSIYFTLGRGRGMGALNWDIRGLILAEDGVTVQDTFAFCIATSVVDNAYSHWEFLRRYMEEGPQAVGEAVTYCMPVDGVHETFAFSKECIFANDAQSSGFMYLTMAPFNLVHAMVRWLVVQTCRIPAFPPQIEAALQPDADDLHARDALMNPEDLR